VDSFSNKLELNELLIAMMLEAGIEEDAAHWD